jgi:hypothetical protein
MLYQLDGVTGRELIIEGWEDGTITVSIFRDPVQLTTRYRVKLPPQQVVELALAAAAHAHRQGADHG